MSGFALLEVQRALYTKLSGDGVLMGLVEGVYDTVPQNTAYPYVVIGNGVQQDQPADGVALSDCMVELQVVTETAGRKEALTIMSRLQALLHLGTLSISGFTLLTIRVEQSATNVIEEGKLLRGVMRVVLAVAEV